MSSHILNDEEIVARLGRGEIFLSGSWDPSSVRASGYDVRMATDLILVPDQAGSPARFYPKGKHRPAEVVLQPGDVAFVSSAEKFCVPWDLSGILGPKFSLAARGILTLTGLIVDPGYGLTLDGETWIAKDDQRVHFLLANVGPEPVVLMPGHEKIASVQFAPVKPAKHKKEILSIGYNRIEDAHLTSDRHAPVGLVFFRKMSDLAEKSKITDVKLEEFHRRLTGIEAGSNQIVMFGIYLLCVTLLGVVFSFLIGAIQSDRLPKQMAAFGEMLASSWWVLLLLLLAFIGFCFIGLKTIIGIAHLVRWALRNHTHPRQDG